MPEQQSAVVEHMPMTGEQVHDPDVQSQSPQLPVDGPVAVPVWQVPVEAHQPQVERPVHEPQLVEVLQGSAVLHWKRVQSQSAQEPAPGPLLLPPRQVEVLAHQPQLDTPVHASQSACPAQVVVHSVALLSHSPAQVPVVGPAKLPGRQVLLPVHQPQPESAAQLAQSVCDVQPPTVHEPTFGAQSAQLPMLGPLVAPSMHVPVLLHQPQPNWSAQSAQVA